jgi:glycosyltransferase involved in cell wall biosynthesis
MKPISLVSIVLPVYNQADHLAEAVTQYVTALERLPSAYELILVPNNCRDDSERICAGLSATHPTVRTVVSRRGGWGLAVKLGLAAAHGDLLCYTNLARTSADDLLLLLVYALTFPQAVIKANRKIRESLLRRAGSLLYNLQVRALFDLSYWDINGTPKVFPRSMNGLLALTRDDDLIDAEFCAVCRQAGYPLLEVPIFSSRRHGGRSTTGWRSALRLYRGAFALRKALRKERG